MKNQAHLQARQAFKAHPKDNSPEHRALRKAYLEKVSLAWGALNSFNSVAPKQIEKIEEGKMNGQVLYKRR